VLRDSDKAIGDAPTEPIWMNPTDFDFEVVRVFQSHPTLEPSITPGNEALIEAAMDHIVLAPPATITRETVHDLFSGAKAAKGGTPAKPAGAGASRKAEFALAIAELMSAERRNPSEMTITVPQHIAEVFEFLYPQPPQQAGGSAAP
jgi:putative ATP-dependent endonuclease of OLD family